ncbi:MAG: hypothetical protein V1650_04210 [Candidatus Omnitrophota bacterium]
MFGKQFSLISTLKYSLKDDLLWLVKDLEMRKRLIITIGILIFVQTISYIPLPGINLSILGDSINRAAKERFSILALGLAPFFTACIFLQLGSAFIPYLRKLLFAGASGRVVLAKYTYIFTIVLSIIQSYLIALWLENPARFEGLRLVANPGMGFRLMSVATMTAAVILLLFIADIINKRGIGNGIALIFIAHLAGVFLKAIYTMFVLIKDRQMAPFIPFLVTTIFIILVSLAYYLTNRVKVVEAKDSSGNKVYIPLRASMVGIEPISLGQSLAILPLTLATFINSPWLRNLAINIQRNFLFGNFIVLVLTLALIYVYAKIIFSPKYINSLMSKYGYGHSDMAGPQNNYLNNTMLRTLILTGGIFTFINLLSLLGYYFKMPFLVAVLFGSGVLLMVGIFSDIISQVEFFRSKSASGIKDWAICCVAFDEIEAQIKSEYLKNNKIIALVEPLRFSWGMPVRTIVDQYRIYVPFDKKDEAANLIK